MSAYAGSPTNLKDLTQHLSACSAADFLCGASLRPLTLRCDHPERYPFPSHEALGSSQPWHSLPSHPSSQPLHTLALSIFLPDPCSLRAALHPSSPILPESRTSKSEESHSWNLTGGISSDAAGSLQCWDDYQNRARVRFPDVETHDIPGQLHGDLPSHQHTPHQPQRESSLLTTFWSESA